MTSRATRMLSRWQACGLHLLASTLLAVLAGLLIFGLWYPQPYTQATGAGRLMLLLIGSNLVLGPLLTLIVYKHGKKGMSFDIAFIAMAQLAALVYGLLVISSSRPVFVVVGRDMTFLTSASDIADGELAAAADPAFARRSWTGPLLVAAPPPESAAERDALLMSGMAGHDINVLPKYFRPFTAAGAALIDGAHPLQRLLELPATATAVGAFVAESGLPIEQLRFQPLRCRDPAKDLTIVFDRASARIVGVIGVDPWPAIPARR